MKKTSAALDANCERSADAIGEAVSQKLLADARQIIDTARANAVRSVDFNIAHTLYAQLNWSQYKLLISIEDAQKREYYQLEAVSHCWTKRELEEWRSINRFCGKCGSSMQPHANAAERALVCPKCGYAAYPKLSPAVIVLVTKGKLGG